MRKPVARLHSLRSVQLRVPTLAESRDFYADVWGLAVVEDDRDDAWLRGTGENHHVLHLTRAVHNGLGKISFALRSASEPPHCCSRGASAAIAFSLSNR